MKSTGQDKSMTGSAVMNLASMVQYGEGAVVSRALIQKNAGNVTLFAFDAQAVISEHSAPYDALVVCLEGRMTVTLGGKEHEIKGGETLLMPAGIPHGLKAGEKSKMLLVMVKE